DAAKLPPLEWGNGILAVPGGRTLLVSNEAGVLVWDLETGKEVRRLAGAGEQMVLSPDGKTLITNSGALQRWELATGKPLYPDNFDHGHAQEVAALVVSADGKKDRELFVAQGYFSSADDVTQPTDWVGTWDLPGGTLVSKAPLRAVHGKYSSLSRDGKSLITHNAVMNLDILKERVQLEGVGTYTGLAPRAMSHDGLLIAGDFAKEQKNVIGPDGARVWEAATGKTVAHLKTRSW